MIWLFAILAVLVLGAVVVVAAGRGGELAEAFDDRPDVRVRADGPLTAADLRQVRFTTALRGYRMSEVDSLLERLAAELDRDRRRPEAEPGSDSAARHRADDPDGPGTDPEADPEADPGAQPHEKPEED